MEQTKTFFVTGLLPNGWGHVHFLDEKGKKVDIAVKGVLPGERVCLSDVRRCRKMGTSSVAHVASFFDCSEHRVSPECGHFAICGGCSLQHISYEEQVAFKERCIRKLFQPICGEAIEIDPIRKSPSTYRFRNKMEFTFSQDRSGKKFLGLFSCNTHPKIISLKECPIAPSWMMEVVCAVDVFWNESALFAYNPHQDIGTLQTLTLRNSQTTGDRLVMLTVSSRPEFAMTKKDLDGFVNAVKTVLASSPAQVTIVLRIKQAIKKHPTTYYEMILSGPDFMRENIAVDVYGQKRTVEFHISPQSFFQPNTQQAQCIYEIGLKKAFLDQETILYDLYCGIGIFGMVAAPFVHAAYGIEISPESAYDAKTNSDRLGLKNFFIKTGDVGTIAADLADVSLKGKKTVAIVDPPRVGLQASGISQLIRLNPETIVYVSCNPVTQALDVQTLCSHGWKIVSVSPIDQFPQTSHVENIVSLCRASPLR